MGYANAKKVRTLSGLLVHIHMPLARLTSGFPGILMFEGHMIMMLYYASGYE